jgi:thiol-disulfide isomerase/thioredoxin
MTSILRLTAVLCAIGVTLAAGATNPEEVRVGQELHPATLQGLNGPSRELAEFRGRPLIINVWASWCGPCRAEMASLERLAWRDQGKAVTIIGISTDDSVDDARAWLKQSNATLNQFIDQHLQMEHMLGASRLPLTVLVDSHGRVLDKIYGAREWDSPESIAFVSRTFHPGAGP